MLNFKKMKISSKILSILMVVAITVTIAVPVFASEANNDIPIVQAINANDVMSIENKDTAVKTQEQVLQIPDEFREAVKNREVAALTAKGDGKISTVDAKGNTKYVNTDISQYAYCDHKTEDVYVYKHTSYSDGSCEVEKWSGIRCTKCGKAWEYDLLSTTTYPSCPH